MKKIFATIIIYNKKAKNSETLACFEKIKSELDFEVQVILVDNSSQQNNNEEFCKDNNIDYISMEGNVGLAKAYNAAVKYIGTICDDYVMCIFDDDTILTSDYFNKLCVELKNKPKKTVFLPMIYDAVGLLSPSVIKGVRVKRVEHIKLINDENITGINTGMAITSDVYNNIKYNTHMFLDYVDHEFLRECKKLGYNIKILDTNLKQNFFDNEKHSFNTVFVRFTRFNKDYKIFCKDKKFYCFIIRLVRGLKLSIRHSNFKFLFHVFK